MNISLLSLLLSCLAGLVAGQQLGGPDVCECRGNTITNVPAFNITNFTWAWDPTNNTDTGSFNMAFWPGVPPASCSFAAAASTGYPVSVPFSSAFCFIGRPEDSSPSDLSIYFHLMDSSTVRFQIIVPEKSTDSGDLVFTIELRDKWIYFKGICNECLHWGRYNMTVDQFVWDGDGREYIGPMDFSVPAFFSHI